MSDFKVDPNKVLQMLRAAATTFRPIVPIAGAVATTIDLARAATVIQMPVRGRKRIGDQPPVQILSKVTDCIDKLFPRLKGELRQNMIAAVSQKISEDPHTQTLLSSSHL